MGQYDGQSFLGNPSRAISGGHEPQPCLHAGEQAHREVFFVEKRPNARTPERRRLFLGRVHFFLTRVAPTSKHLPRIQDSFPERRDESLLLQSNEIMSEGDYRVADISLADFGRREIDIAEHEVRVIFVDTKLPPVVGSSATLKTCENSMPVMIESSLEHLPLCRTCGPWVLVCVGLSFAAFFAFATHMRVPLGFLHPPTLFLAPRFSPPLHGCGCASPSRRCSASLPHPRRCLASWPAARSFLATLRVPACPDPCT